MKRVWLIRHGQHDWVGKALVGRMLGVHLNAEGRAQARAIARALQGMRLAAIYSSPQPRCLETAQPLADAQSVPVLVDQALDEIDFGEWTARSFDELELDSRWHEWNARRSQSVAPGGESMRCAQERIVAAIERLARPQPVAFVTHCDIIRAAMLAALGRPLDDIHAIAVETGALVLLEGESARSARVTIYAPNDTRWAFSHAA